jgi:glycosyltransferase involved in cell wall biosynthesis
VSLYGFTKEASPLVRESDAVLYGSSVPEKMLLRIAMRTGISWRVKNTLSASAPDLVHVHFVAGHALPVTFAAVQCGIPGIITAHGFDVTTPRYQTGLRGARSRARIRTILKRASLIIAVSGFIRSQVIELGGDPAKVIVHHIGIPIAPLEQQDSEKKWDVAFVGRFVEKKGVLDLIGALGRLQSEFDPRCVFIGDGPLLMLAREVAQHAGINAAFLGAQPPSVVQEVLRTSRVFAAPSRTASNGDTEGLPIAILEAAAAGLPVVSTYHSGIPEAVLDGVTGLLSQEGDKVALASNLRRLLMSPELCSRIGRAGRLWVEREFDIVKQTAQLEKIYDAVARGDQITL